jgi:hypothetical protein
MTWNCLIRDVGSETRKQTPAMLILSQVRLGQKQLWSRRFRQFSERQPTVFQTTSIATRADDTAQSVRPTSRDRPLLPVTPDRSGSRSDRITSFGPSYSQGSRFASIRSVRIWPRSRRSHSKTHRRYKFLARTSTLASSPSRPKLALSQAQHGCALLPPTYSHCRPAGQVHGHSRCERVHPTNLWFRASMSGCRFRCRS